MEKIRFWTMNPLFPQYALSPIKGTDLECTLIYSERDKEYRRYIIREKEEQSSNK